MGQTHGWHNSEHSRGNFPELVWYDFRRALKVAEVSFQPRADRNGAGITQTPTSFQLVGSNDHHCNQHSDWTVLCQDLSASPTRNVYHTRYCRVKNPKASYRCLGLKMLNNNDVHGWISLSHVRFWVVA